MANDSLGALVIQTIDAYSRYKYFRKLLDTQCDTFESLEFQVDCYEHLALPYLERLEDSLEELREVVCGSPKNTSK